METQPYIHKRFEDYMVRVDRGELPRDLAITALREEIEYAESEEQSGQGKEATDGNS